MYRKILNLADWRFVLLIIIVSAMILRAPYLFSNPRFWAEEGAVYFYFAFHNSFFEAIFSPHQGYYSLYPNLMTLLAARLVSLEHAPLFTTVAAMLVQIVPYILILYRLNHLSIFHKFILCVATFFVVHTGEVWLNTITAQFHFALASFFILLAEQTEASDRQLLLDRLIIFFWWSYRHYYMLSFACIFCKVFNR